MERYYSIGEIAKILNISTSKLRYYDKNRIISPEIRKENGYRYYSEKQIILLKKIMLATKSGFHLKEIKLLLSNREVEEKIIRNALERIREEISSLQSFEKSLEGILEKRAKKERDKLSTPIIENLDTIYGLKLMDETKIDEKCFMPEDFLRKIDQYEGNITLNIVEKKFKDLGERRVLGKTYIVLNKEELNKEVVLEGGKYLTLTTNKYFDDKEIKESFTKLLEWVKREKLSIVEDRVFIIFETEILNIRDEIYKIVIKLKD